VVQGARGLQPCLFPALRTALAWLAGMEPTAAVAPHRTDPQPYPLLNQNVVIKVRTAIASLELVVFNLLGPVPGSTSRPQTTPPALGAVPIHDSCAHHGLVVQSSTETSLPAGRRRCLPFPAERIRLSAQAGQGCAGSPMTDMPALNAKSHRSTGLPYTFKADCFSSHAAIGSANPERAKRVQDEPYTVLDIGFGYRPSVGAPDLCRHCHPGSDFPTQCCVSLCDARLSLLLGQFENRNVYEPWTLLRRNSCSGPAPTKP
jgi:hypothetical protein